MEWWLAYRPWDGETQQKSYREAISRAGDPVPEFDTSVTSLASDLENNPEMRAWMEGLFGRPLTADKSIFLWTMMLGDIDTKIIRIEGEETDG